MKTLFITISLFLSSIASATVSAAEINIFGLKGVNLGLQEKIILWSIVQSELPTELEGVCHHRQLRDDFHAFLCHATLGGQSYVSLAVEATPFAAATEALTQLSDEVIGNLTHDYSYDYGTYDYGYVYEDGCGGYDYDPASNQMSGVGNCD